MDINSNRDAILLGGNKPFLVDSAIPPRSNLVINSADYKFRVSSFNFVVAVDEPYNKSRTARMTKLSIPLPPNVNTRNYNVVMRVGNYIIDFNMRPGYYDTTGLCAMFNNEVSIAMLAHVPAIAGSITLEYDPVIRCFSCKFTGGVGNINFGDACSFITRGRNLCNFIGINTSIAPTSTTLISGLANMVYSKYITVNSDALTRNTSAGLSRTSHPTSADTSVIGVLDIDDSAYYMNNNIAYNTDLVPETSSVLLFNSKQINKLPNDIDIFILDEFNLDFSSCFEGLSNSPSNPRCLVFIQIEY